MKKFGKILAIVLSLAVLASVLCVTLCACNKDTKDDGPKTYLVVGVTDYPPFDYQDDSKNWTGFDAEVAKLVAKTLGYDDAKFVEINWDNKIIELQSKQIDCIWNGMTMTEDLEKEMIFSTPYATNSQVAVIKKSNASKFNSEETIKACQSITAEGGSAGETTAKELAESKYVDSNSQMDALNEVNMGTTEIAIVDYSLAKSQCGKGSFENLQIVEGLSFSEEKFAIGFRKDDVKLRDNVNILLDAYLRTGVLSRLQKQFGEDSIALIEE